MIREFKRPYIIAEIGSSHLGNFDLAIRTIKEAKIGGADCVKFQLFDGETLVHPKLKTLNYIKYNKFKYQLDRFNKMKLSLDQIEKFYNLTKKIKIDFCVTPFDPLYVKKLNKFVKFFKVASGDLNFYPLLNEIKKTNKVALISTGMSKYDDIERSLKYLNKKKTVIMHCVSSYPTENKDINLKNIYELKKKFKLPVGFSDHTVGIDAAIQSISFGANVIEKHFVPLKGSTKSADFPLSVNLKNLREMKKKIYLSYQMMGKKKDIVLKNEKYGEKNLKRSIYSSKLIKKGELITEKNLICLRPYNKNGIKIENYYDILNKKCKLEIKKLSLLKKKNINFN